MYSMNELIQSCATYTYGYNDKKMNCENILIEKEKSFIYECSIPDEIFDTENFTLIDRIRPKPERIKPIVEFIINDKDCLFWTFYIMVNGLDNYSQIGVKNVVCEKKEKLQLIDNVIHKNSTFLKESKIRITKHIIQDLAYEKKINFQTFQVLCLLHKISFIVKYKQCYYEYKNPQENTSTEPVIIELRENKSYKILVLNLDKNKNMEECVDVSSAIGFTCYYKWSGIKKKIGKTFAKYTDEINVLGSFFQSNT